MLWNLAGCEGQWEPRAAAPVLAGSEAMGVCWEPLTLLLSQFPQQGWAFPTSDENPIPTADPAPSPHTRRNLGLT